MYISVSCRQISISLLPCSVFIHFSSLQVVHRLLNVMNTLQCVALEQKDLERKVNGSRNKPLALHNTKPRILARNFNSTICIVKQINDIVLRHNNFLYLITTFLLVSCILYHFLPAPRGEFRPRQTRQLPRAADLKGRLLN